MQQTSVSNKQPIPASIAPEQTQDTTHPKDNIKLLVAIISSFTVGVLVGIAAFILFQPRSTLTKQNQNISNNPTPSSSPAASSSIVVSANFSQFNGTHPIWKDQESNDQNTNQIHLIDPQSQEKTLLATVSDLYSSHYHHSEFHSGQLYSIRRISQSNTDSNDKQWSDELWRYDGATEQILFTSKGIDFRASPQNQFVALKHNNTNELLFLNQDGQEVQLFKLEQLLQQPQVNPNLNLLGWSAGGETFWGSVNFTAYPYNYFSIDTTDWQVTHYSLPESGFGYTLNYDSGIVAYHTFPALFDAETEADYLASNPTVDLKVFDLNTGEEQIVATTTAEPFTFSWLDESTIEYSTESLGTNTVQIY